MRLGGFAYRIDYDSAIAADERELAALLSPAATAVSAYLDAHLDKVGSVRRAADFILSDFAGVASRAASIGIADPADLGAWLSYADADPRFEGHADVSGWYRRGECVDARISSIPCMPSLVRKAEIARVKARLSRHKRNRERHGR